MFYYYTAKCQKTNQIKANIDYTAKALRWTEDKVRKTKKALISLGLVEDLVKRNERNSITGHYIKFLYSL
jgi:hypothetical protein